MENSEIKINDPKTEFPKMGIFAVWKPKGISSNAAVQIVKRNIGDKKKKVGHAGTLDPLAEGILVMAAGRESTKLISKELAKEKEYIADIFLGATSSTDDSEGDKTVTYSGKPIDYQKVEETIGDFCGTIMQRPPIWSAIKIGGKEAYKHARKGNIVEMKERPVNIYEIRILEYKWPNLRIRVLTGPGTYIRSLARDIGEKLETGAYMSGLVRTRVGEYAKENAFMIDEWSKKRE